MRTNWIAMAVLGGMLGGCSGPTLFVKDPEGAGAEVSTIQFQRARNVVGSSGANYTIVDMGDGVPANGRIVVDTSINPYRHYRDTGNSRPNLAYLSGPQPVQGSLLALVVDEAGRVRAEVANGSATVWGGGPYLEGLTYFSRVSRILSPSAAPLVTETRGYEFTTIPPAEREQLAAMAKSLPAGQALHAVYALVSRKNVCRVAAPKFEDAYKTCTTPVQVVGTTGFGGEGITWKRPPGKMRLLVVSPHVQAARYQGEIEVEAGKTYHIEFDGKEGAFSIR